MPTFPSREIDIMADMAGCPNRCRHCWLGNPENRRMSEATARDIVAAFRAWTRPGEREPYFRRVGFISWYREPDFSPDYRRLHELERELNGGKATRFELLSIWRLARDEGYAGWAREVGTEVCQVSFFGMEETTDWFARRRGAFRDNIVATGRLLAAGIRPRWQIFLTTRSLPELDAMVGLVQSLDLDRRVRALGAEFDVFLNTMSPDGEAWDIEDLRPEADVLVAIPPYLAEKTLAHFRAASLQDALGRPEAHLVPGLLADDRPHGAWPEHLAFMVASDLDVCSNVGDLMPWWRLGNLERDGVGEIIRRFEADEPPGMRAHFGVPVRELARRYSRPGGGKLYDKRDLTSRLVRSWAQDVWERRRG